MGCNCGGIKHEYSKEYLERKAKEKVLKALEEKKKNAGSTDNDATPKSK